jgi:hypothetical protein
MWYSSIIQTVHQQFVSHIRRHHGGSISLPVFIKQKADKLVLSLREGSTFLMTRDRFKEMKMTALESLRSDVELYRKDQALQGFIRDELEQKYQTILQMQAEWERGGFWTEENEKRYKEMYKGLH